MFQTFTNTRRIFFFFWIEFNTRIAREASSHSLPYKFHHFILGVKDSNVFLNNFHLYQCSKLYKIAKFQHPRVISYIIDANLLLWDNGSNCQPRDPRKFGLLFAGSRLRSPNSNYSSKRIGISWQYLVNVFLMVQSKELFG